jgi:hypothetical protein
MHACMVKFSKIYLRKKKSLVLNKRSFVFFQLSLLRCNHIKRFVTLDSIVHVYIIVPN